MDWCLTRSQVHHPVAEKGDDPCVDVGEVREVRERTKAQNRNFKGTDQGNFSSLHRVGVPPSIEIRVRLTMIVIRFCIFQVQLHHDLSSSLIDHRDVLGTAPDDKMNKKNKEGTENRKRKIQLAPL